jgi:hypothetical protein
MNAVKQHVKKPVETADKKPDQKTIEPGKEADKMKDKTRIDAFIAKHKKLLVKLAK